jgi:hypothetical protein
VVSLVAVSVIMPDGRCLEGDTALDVVRKMNRRALIGEPDPWRYMIALARRVRRLTGVGVRTTSPETFLLDLAAAGVLTVEGVTAAGRHGAGEQGRAPASDE